MLKTLKIDVENQHVFDIDYFLFGSRFGGVFGRVFGPKIHAKSDLKKSVRQAKSIVKTNTKS